MLSRLLFILLVSVPALAQTVSLRAGWNGVGFAAPQVATLSAPSSVAGLTFWDGTAYPTRPVTPAAINEGEGTKRGFWVFATEPASLTYTGTGTTGAFVDLRAGWNLVAFPTTVSNLSVPNTVLPQFQEIQPDSTYLTVTQVQTGRPYWIFASAATRLTWSNPQPSPSPSPSASPSPSPRFSVVSQNPSVGAANGPSFTTTQRGSTLSGDGRFLVYASNATNLVVTEGPVFRHVYLYDRTTGQNTRVSVGTNGTPSVGNSRDPVISADGRWIAYVNSANLIPGDNNNADDVYVYDRLNVTASRISPSGGDAPSISGDGRFVTFETDAALVASDTNGVRDVYLLDRNTSALTRVSVATGGGQANAASTGSSLSPNGRWVAFASAASNLVAADVNTFPDVFLHEIATQTTVLASRAPGGLVGDQPSRASSLTTDGNFVCFTSAATNLAPNDGPGEDVFVYDNNTQIVSRIANGEAGAIAADGRYVVYQSGGQIFIFDRVMQQATGTGTTLSSLPSISGDGLWIAFQSLAGGLQNVYLGKGNQ